jgi:hypothetical protein
MGIRPAEANPFGFRASGSFLTKESVMYRAMVVTALSLVALGGCSESGPSVEYVEGVVTLDGQPIEGVNVGFAPVDEKTGTSAVGTTDASGTFKLTAIPNGAPGAGAKAGDYLVTFSKVTSSDPNAAMTTDDPNYGKLPEGGAMSQPATSTRVIPEKYENPATSGIKVTVKPGKNAGPEFKFDLKKDG